MTRLYGLLSQASTSLAVALLAVALATAASRTAFAEPVPVPVPSDCTDTSKCTPCEYPCSDVCFGNGQCGPNYCNCTQDGSKCKCETK
jgi:hypothetical protein